MSHWHVQIREVDNSAVHAGHRIQTKRYANADAEKINIKTMSPLHHNPHIF